MQDRRASDDPCFSVKFLAAKPSCQLAAFFQSKPRQKKIIEGMDASIWKRLLASFSWPALPMTCRIKRMSGLSNYFRTQRWDTWCSGRKHVQNQVWFNIRLDGAAKFPAWGSALLYYSIYVSLVGWNLLYLDFFIRRQPHCLSVREICNIVTMFLCRNLACMNHATQASTSWGIHNASDNSVETSPSRNFFGNSGVQDWTWSP